MQIEGTYNIDYYRNLVADKVHCHDSLWFVGGAQWNAVQASSAKLAKMVSAIANSGGGELIFGIAQKRSRAEAFEPVKGFDKGEEWIFHEIQSQIDKPIDDLSVKICPIPDSDGKIIHIHIPANNNAPHQFTDSKFYRWNKGKCLVMNESEVRMAYMKISTCNLEFLGVTNINGIPTLSGGKFSSMNFYPKFMIRNAGNIVEKDYKVEIAFPSALFEETNQPLKSAFVRHEGIYSVFGQRGNYPIFQQEISTIIEAKITVTAENIDTFLKEYLNIYLYFSNGLKKHSIRLADTLTYNGRRLAKEDFGKGMGVINI